MGKQPQEQADSSTSGDAYVCLTSPSAARASSVGLTHATSQQSSCERTLQAWAQVEPTVCQNTVHFLSYPLLS